ncbi:MAG TPA: tetratricopeptide repeat protein [Smithella sp.]|nr:tetratricopeptide repeat protein [Smithella sp.]
MLNISHGKKTLIVCIALILVTSAVYWQVNHFDFITLDDHAYVAENNHIQSGITWDGFRWAFSTKDMGLWNPLVWLSFMLDYQLYGLNAAGYHVTNLILHIFSTLLLFWLFNRMTGALLRSAFVAALFALHPLHVESVAWVAERKDVLCAFFWMLTLCLYVYYTEKPVLKRYLMVVFSFVLALMSKPMVVTLPVILLLLDFWPLNRLQSRKIATAEPEFISPDINNLKKKNKAGKADLKKNISAPQAQKLSQTKIAGIIPLWQLWEKIPFFVLSAVLTVITINTPNVEGSSLKFFSLQSRLANAPVAFVNYLLKTLMPYNLAAFYPFSDQLPLWQVAGAVLLIVAVSAAVIVLAKRLPYLFFGWLWFAITILPVIGILQISLMTPYAMADRYHYLPSIGLFVMMAWGVPLLFECAAARKKIMFAASVIFLAVMAVLTWRQCAYWQNSTELWTHALRVTKGNYIAYNDLGITLANVGKYKEAIDYYNKAISFKQDFVYAYNNRGNAYHKLGRYQLAIEDYSKATRLRPDYITGFVKMGNANSSLNEYQRAIENYNQVIRLAPDYVDAYINRGTAYASLGQYQRAIDDYDEAIRMKPDHPYAYYNMACVLARQKKAALACDWLRMAMARGYDIGSYIKDDKDFDNIRNEPCFIALLKASKK